MTNLPSPLSLPFELAAQPTQLLKQIREAAEQEIRADIVAAGTKSLGSALAGAKFVMENRHLSVVFTEGIPRGARLMEDKLGRQLPKLIDGKTGRILQTARAAKGAKAVRLTASAALVLVEASHAISAHDNAVRLKRIEKDVARLVHSNQSELKARLEGIYRYAREIAGPGAGKLSRSDQDELGRLCLDLMQLRAQWRENFLFELSSIDPAQSDLLTLNRKSSYRKNLAKRAEQAEAILESVQWMHFTLLLQMTLSAQAGRGDRFLSITLVDEAASWRAFSDRVNELALKIAGQEQVPPELHNLLGHISSLATVWNIRPEIGKTTKKLKGSEA